jgi:histidyl-tRNA synthetase
LKDATALRGEGRQVLVSQMNKNKKFQKEQLKKDGYEDIREYFNR